MKGILIGTDHPHSWMYQDTLVQIKGLDIVGIVHDGGRVTDKLADVPTFEDLKSLFSGLSARDEAEGDPSQRVQAPQVDFDVAFVFLPADELPPVVDALIRAGKHVFCEKPVTRTAADIAPLVNLAHDVSVVFGAGYQWRVHPIVRWIKNQIDAGYLGELQHIEARLMTTTIEARGADHYIFDKARSGGGITHWLGCHHIDMLRYFTDDEVTDVSAVTATFSKQSVDVEDLAVATLRFSGGCLAGLQQGYLLPAPTDDPFGSSPYDMFIAIRGEKGYIRWDPTTTDVEMYSIDPRMDGSPKRQLSFDLSKRDGYGGIVGYMMISEFLKAVETGGVPPSTGDDALEALKIVEAMYRSAEEGRIIKMNESD